MAVDILNLQMPNSDRDLHIVMPVLEHLRQKHGLRIVSRNIFNGLFNVLLYRPKMVVIANPYGQDETYLMLKLLRRLGIRSASMIVEGNFHREMIDSYLWGWNRDRTLWEDVMIVWNAKSLTYAAEAFPEVAPRLCVSGAVGFDRYRLLNFLSKETFLKENNIAAKKVVGISGWGLFSHFLDKHYMDNYREDYLYFLEDSQIDLHMEDLGKLRALYRKLIEQNPDIHFILRMHPQALSIDQTEFKGCEDLPNVFVSNQRVPGTYTISDVISASDVWVAYDSGTAIEAWLLGKSTVLINPTRTDFLRECQHRGSPKVATLEQLQASLDAFFETGVLPGFPELADAREEIMEEVIGFSDGKSHERAAAAVWDVFQKARRPGWQFWRNFPYRQMLGQWLRYMIYPTTVYRWFRGFNAGPTWYRKDPKESQRVESLYRRALGGRADG
jgi:hypothetical protein